MGPPEAILITENNDLKEKMKFVEEKNQERDLEIKRLQSQLNHKRERENEQQKPMHQIITNNINYGIQNSQQIQ